MKRTSTLGRGVGATARGFREMRCPFWVRYFGLAGALLFAVAVVGCGGPTDVTGEWEGTMEFEDSAGGLTSADLDLSLEQADDRTVSGAGLLTVRTPTETEETELSEVVGRVSEDGEVRLAGSGGDFLSSSGIDLGGVVGVDSMEGDARMATEGTIEGLLSDEAPEVVSGTFELEREE